MIEKNNQKLIIKSESKYLRVSPLKLRRILRSIMNLKDLDKARSYLSAISLNSALLLLKALDSAIANANHNFGVSKNDLIIDKFLVNEGPRLKRFHARARGRGSKIIKPFSHVLIELIKVR